MANTLSQWDVNEWGSFCFSVFVHTPFFFCFSILFEVLLCINYISKCWFGWACMPTFHFVNICLNYEKKWNVSTLISIQWVNKHRIHLYWLFIMSKRLNYSYGAREGGWKKVQFHFRITTSVKQHKFNTNYMISSCFSVSRYLNKTFIVSSKHNRIYRLTHHFFVLFCSNSNDMIWSSTIFRDNLHSIHASESQKLLHLKNLPLLVFNQWVREWIENVLVTLTATCRLKINNQNIRFSSIEEKQNAFANKCFQYLSTGQLFYGEYCWFCGIWKISPNVSLQCP